MSDTVRQEICIRCKGKGRLWRDRIFKSLKGFGLFMLGIVTTNLFDWGMLGILLILSGVGVIMFAQVAKCPVCNGSGKVI